MKTGFVSAIVVAVLLLGFLVYWKARPPEGATPGSHSQAQAAPTETSVVLSDEAVGPEETARSEATIASPVVKGDLASSGAPVVGALATVTTSSSEKRRDGKKADADEDEVFDRKYGGLGAEARQEAVESLRVRLFGSGEPGLGKQPALTEEQSMEIKRELEWLTEHPGS